MAQRIGGLRQQHRQLAADIQAVARLPEPPDPQVEHLQRSWRIAVHQNLAQFARRGADPAPGGGVVRILESRLLRHLQILLEAIR